MMKGTWNGVNSFVGFEVENELRRTRFKVESFTFSFAGDL